MSDSPIEIEYCLELDELAELLEGVTRGGSFATSGALTSILPGLIVEDVGRIAFPLLPEQAERIASTADQAPYGRGEDTLIDRSVRDVLQIAPGRFQLLGDDWDATLGRIVKQVTQGLGCETLGVKADLYKLLLYPSGGFFTSHRDTEKAPGMFATLVVCLPSEHSGGELLVRHNQEECRIDLSSHRESEILFAAFYCDCEHEVLPVDSGHRLCLVYNLIQVSNASSSEAEPSLAAPDYQREISEAARILSEWEARDERSPKLVYLLDHQYTPAGLCFEGLKLQDSARVQLLTRAADLVDFEIRLGIVHIIETGCAEVYGYSRHGHWDDDDAGTPDDYELLEAYDHEQNIDSWIDRKGQNSDFGAIHIDDDELLPRGALDNEAPDEIRVSEATGNEGGSYERAYHRAAAVVWPRSETEDLLLQAGVDAVVPFFRERITRSNAKADQAATKRLGKKILIEWHRQIENRTYYGEYSKENRRSSIMLSALNDFGDPGLVLNFLDWILVHPASRVLFRVCPQKSNLRCRIRRTGLSQREVTEHLGVATGVAFQQGR